LAAWPAWRTGLPRLILCISALIVGKEPTGAHAPVQAWEGSMRLNSYFVGAAVASAMVCAASAGHAAPASAIGGKITLPIAISFQTAPASTFTSQFSSLSCELTITSDDLLKPVDTVTAPVKVTGAAGSCSLAMSYLWHVVNTKSHMTVSFSVSGIAVDSMGHQTLTRISSGGVEQIVLPANGATTAIKNFKVVL